MSEIYIAYNNPALVILQKLGRVSYTEHSPSSVNISHDPSSDGLYGKESLSSFNITLL